MGERAEPWDGVPQRWLYGGVLLLTAFVFGSTLTFGFVYDDHWTLLGNGFLRDLSNLPMLLGREAAAAGVPDAFRPTLVVFDALTYALFGLSPVAHHITSVLLHVLVTGLVGLWLAREGAPRRVVITATTLFGVLAIHGEAVAVVSYREDLLAAALGLGAAVLVSASLRSKSWLHLGGAGVLMALASGAKLSVAGLPLVWVAMKVLSPWATPVPTRRLLFPAATLLAGVAAVVAFRAIILDGLDPYGASERVFAHRVGLGPVLAASAQIHLGYLQQLWLPRALSPEYVDYGAAWGEPATVLALLAFSGLTLLALAAARGRRAPLLAWVIIAAFILAAPTSNLAPMPNMRADRFVYLTSVPVCVGMAVALLRTGAWLKRRWGLHPLAPWIAMVVLQGSVAQGVTAAYRSDSRLWQIALRRAPHSARGHAIVGELLVATLRDQPDPLDRPLLLVRARTHCALALHYDPKSPLPHLCEARLAAAERDWPRSHASFERALKRMSTRPERARLALASTALDLPGVPYEQRVRRAFEGLERARREAPYVAEVFAVSGRLRHRLGEPQGAASDYARASDLHPERWDVVMAGVELQLDLGHTAAASQQWNAATAALDEAPTGRVQALQRRIDAARRLQSDQP
ncbi:MAG: tetratricopeptide repeat protein [Nannocystales bacterium]